MIVTHYLNKTLHDNVFFGTNLRQCIFRYKFTTMYFSVQILRIFEDFAHPSEDYKCKLDSLAMQYIILQVFRMSDIALYSF